MGGKKISVLVVDDSLLVRKQLRGFLEEQGCEVEEAADSIRAFQIIETFKPDLILLDIVMPGQDGIKALQKIREADPNARVVMVSSVGTQSYLKEAIKFGAYDFLQKPVNAEAVSKLLDNWRKKEGSA